MMWGKVKDKRPKKPQTENIGPRTAPARKAVMLMNRLKHRPKSVIIQADSEIVVQVRGDYDDLVAKLQKAFKNKGKDESGGVMRIHSWRLRALGLMNVYSNEHNDFMSVRFLHMPELGVRRKSAKELEAELAVVKAAEDLTQKLMDGVKVTPKIIDTVDGDDLDAIRL